MLSSNLMIKVAIEWWYILANFEVFSKKTHKTIVSFFRFAFQLMYANSTLIMTETLSTEPGLEVTNVTVICIMVGIASWTFQEQQCRPHVHILSLAVQYIQFGWWAVIPQWKTEKLLGKRASARSQSAVKYSTSLGCGIVLPFTSTFWNQPFVRTVTVSHTTKYYRTMDTATFVQVWSQVSFSTSFIIYLLVLYMPSFSQNY